MVFIDIWRLVLIGQNCSKCESQKKINIIKPIVDIIGFRVSDTKLIVILNFNNILIYHINKNTVSNILYRVRTKYVILL